MNTSTDGERNVDMNGNCFTSGQMFFAFRLSRNIEKTQSSSAPCCAYAHPLHGSPASRMLMKLIAFHGATVFDIKAGIMRFVSKESSGYSKKSFHRRGAGAQRKMQFGSLFQINN